MTEIVNNIYANNTQNGDLPVFTGKFLGILKNGAAGQILTSNGPGEKPTWEDNTSGFITEVDNTATIDLDVTAGKLTADFTSMNISQFINDSGYITSITSGNLIESTSSILTITGGTGAILGSGTSIQVKQANGSQSGYLSSANWTTFNNKASSGANTDITSLASPAIGSATATTQAEGDNSTKVATTAYVDERPIYLNRSKRWEWFVDFESNPSGNFSSEESNFAVASTGAFSSVASTGNNIGIVSIDTGINAAGAAVVGTSITTIQFGNGITYTESLIQIPTLSTNTQRFKTYTGFLDVITSVADGAYISQVDNENSGNWVFTCVNGGVASSFNLSTAPTAGVWYKIAISINAAVTEARCYINGVEPSGVGYPITTNIPTGATNQTGVRTGVVKSVGNTSRSLYVDYLYGKIDFTTPR